MSLLFGGLELARMAERLASTNVTADDDVVLVSSSDQHRSVVEALAIAMERRAGSLTTIVLSPPTVGDDYLHPNAAVRAATSADVVVVATTLAFPRAFDDLTAAVLAGPGRLVLLNNAPPDEFARGAAAADPERLDAETHRLASRISDGTTVRVKSPGGTDFSVGVCRPCYSLTGTADPHSRFGSFPSGEAMLAVEEGTAQGTFVATDFGQVVYLEGSGPPIGLLEDPVTLEIADGRVTNVAGGGAARRLRSILDAGDDNALWIGELGIGTNRRARFIDAVENKFRAGTAHIALGSNRTIGWAASDRYGGTIESGLHIDLVAGDVSVAVDGVTIVERGDWISDEGRAS